MNEKPAIVAPQPNAHRRWYQFSLRTLLIFVTLGGCGFARLGAKIQEARRQQAAVAALLKLGCFVAYDYQFDSQGGDVPDATPPGPAWLHSLFGDGFFENVHTVILVNDEMTDAEMENLKEFSELKSLILGGTRVTDTGLENLTRLTQLIDLTLGGTQVTDTSLTCLRGLTRLETLHLNFTQVTDAGLGNLRGLTQLKFLALDGTQVTDAGLEQFRGLTRLESLQLCLTHVSEAGVAKLHAAIPNCEIVWR